MASRLPPTRLPQAYSPVGYLSARAGTLVLNSFSGADITCSIVVPIPKWMHTAKKIGALPGGLSNLRIFAEIETLSISSARDVYPVRRIGESHVHAYARGGRTVAGTMVFTTMSRDVFAEFYRHADGEGLDDAPMHVDQIPPFHILINAMNEYGVRAASALLNVSLTNWGTTLSIHDLKIESTYSYVAQFYLPFVQDYAGFQAAIARVMDYQKETSASTLAATEMERPASTASRLQRSPDPEFTKLVMEAMDEIPGTE